MRAQASAALAAGGDTPRQVNAPLGMRLAQSAGSYDQAARTVEIVIATETPVKTPGYMIGIDARYYLEILDCSPAAVDLSQVAAGNCPLLDTHSRWALADQLGKVTEGRCENRQVVVVAALGQSEAARTLEADIAAGTAPKTSAGYSRDQVMFERMEGEVPVYRVTKWTLREASFVPIAADQNAGVRSDEQVTFPCILKNGVRTMTEQTGAAGAATDNNQGQAAAGAGEQGQRAAGAGEQGQGSGAAAGAGEQGQAQGAVSGARANLFTATAAIAFVDQARAFGDEVATRAQELVEQNGRGEISVETATSQLLKATSEAQRAATSGVSAGGVRAEVTADARDKFIAGATNSIIQRAGLASMFLAAAKARGEDVGAAQRALDPGEFRGVRNAELARIALEGMGVRVSTYDRDAVVAQALTAARAGNTTSDFTVLLENVMHKTLQAAYMTAPDTWTRFCAIGSVQDFRPHPRYLRGTFGVLDSRTEDGQFKNKSIPDGAKESISATVKGNIVALTRDAIVNDDMGAFSFITVDLGRAAKLSIEVDVYALLAQNAGLGPVMNDGQTLFHATHGNIGAVPAAPSVSSFEDLGMMMAKQKDISGNEYLDIRPSVLVTPIGISGDAKVLNDSQYDPDALNKLQRPNKVRGLFEDIVGTPRITGTRYYAFADKDAHAALEVVFLNGVQEPYLEQRDGWRTDGTEFKVRHDYGVGALNYRSAATNAGA